MNLEFIEVVKTRDDRVLRWACDNDGANMEDLIDAT